MTSLEVDEIGVDVVAADITEKGPWEMNETTVGFDPLCRFTDVCLNQGQIQKRPTATVLTCLYDISTRSSTFEVEMFRPVGGAGNCARERERRPKTLEITLNSLMLSGPGKL